MTSRARLYVWQYIYATEKIANLIFAYILCTQMYSKTNLNDEIIEKQSTAQ